MSEMSRTRGPLASDRASLPLRGTKQRALSHRPASKLLPDNAKAFLRPRYLENVPVNIPKRPVDGCTRATVLTPVENCELLSHLVAPALASPLRAHWSALSPLLFILTALISRTSIHQEHGCLAFLLLCRQQRHFAKSKIRRSQAIRLCPGLVLPHNHRIRNLQNHVMAETHQAVPAHN